MQYRRIADRELGRYSNFGPLRAAAEEQPEFRQLHGIGCQQIMTAQVLGFHGRTAALQVSRSRAEHGWRGTE